MNARERLLVALDGGEPDRIPCALGFYHVDVRSLASRGGDWEDIIDVHFVKFPLSPEEEALRHLAAPYSPDTRLGNPSQVATYARWDYRPETPESRSPLAGARSLDDLREFPFPDVSVPYHAESLAHQVQALHASGLAAGGNLPHLGGELFEAAWRLRGLENFLLDLLERPSWADYLLDRLASLALRNAETLARAGVDVLALDDDVGMPGTMFFSPQTWRRFFKPRMAQIIQAARAIQPDLPVLYHSDGTFEPIIGDLMDIGVNAINPLQPDHMDAARIRKRYGPRLALWGTVGHHTTFNFGHPEEIRAEVKHRIETLGRRGLILCPAYDIDEPDVRPENVTAFVEAVAEYG
ncbi:uroporphyrinogen decarboxylase family protein [Chloroflexota bacterium]